jgi:hypothetical protein
MHFKERVPKRNIDPKEIEEFMKKQKEKKEEKAPLNTVEKPKIVEIKENQIGSTPTVEKKEIKEEPIVRTNPPEEERKNVESLNINSTNDKKIDPKYSSISTHNGDSCDMYNWSQGTNDVSVQIYLLENTSANKVKTLL